MAHYKWSPKFSVGDKDIDADHQGIFALIEELHEADHSAFNPADIISRLEDYAAHHFEREEALMTSVGFPGLDDHIKEHKAFVEWVDTVKHTYRRTTESAFLISDLVNDFLVRWLSDHIMTEDMKYRDFIREKGNS